MMKKIFHKCIYVSVLIAFLAGCANIQAPSGGPPDKEPPKVVEFAPLDKTINFDADRIEIVFDKYMNKNSVVENTYILPSTKMQFDWSGKKLIIEFDEKLKPNTTYSLNISADYSDLKDNKAAESFNLIFSTGAVIDSGLIAGKVFTEQKQSLFVFAYDISSMNSDTLNPITTLSDYKVQVGSNGSFNINGLKDGKYRLFAVVDKFKDGMISDGQDLFSSALKDFEVVGSRSDDALFRLGRNADISAPKLFSMEPLSNRRVKLFFSEAIDSTSLVEQSFLLLDSATNQKFDIYTKYPDPLNSNAIVLITQSPISSDIRLIASVDQSRVSLKDTSGLFFQDTVNMAKYKSSSEPDSSRLYLVRASIKDSSMYVSPDTPIRLIFSDVVSLKSNQAISFFNKTDSSDIEFEIDNYASNSLIINPKSPLKQNNEYLIVIHFDKLRDSSISTSDDTSKTIFFKTADLRSNGSIRGKIEGDLSSWDELVLVIENKSLNSYYQTKLDSEGNWLFESVKGGTYNVWLYYDQNKNNKYDFGNIYPFEPAEKFFVLPNDITAKNRWEVEGIKLVIGK